MKQDLVRVTNTGPVTVQRAVTPAQFVSLADIPPEFMPIDQLQKFF